MMGTFIHASSSAQYWVTMGWCVIFIFNIYLLGREIVIRRKRVWLVSLGILISGSLMSALRMLSKGMYDKMIFLGRFPMAAYVALLLGFLFIIVYELYMNYRYELEHITLESVKEGIDQLPSGMCVYTHDGLVLLENECMEKLCAALTGYTTLNGVHFWQQLKSGELPPGYSRLFNTDEVLIRFPEGTVWFFQNNLTEEDYDQLVAFDVTDEYAMNQQLQENNLRIEKMNEELRTYSLHVDEMVRQEEYLATKIRVHDSLGNILLQAKHFMHQADDEEVKCDLIKNYKRTLQLLIKEGHREPAENQDLETELQNAAGSIGLKLEIHGEVPDSVKVQHLLMSGARECMTNALRHAKATTLYIDIGRHEDAVVITYTNDGELPMRPIVLGGGLTSLQKLVDKQKGASMTFSYRPTFALILTIRMSNAL